MTPQSIKDLAIYIPFIHQVNTSKSSPGIPGEVVRIYNEDGEFGAGLVRPSCPACVAEMVNSLFWAFGRNTGLWKNDAQAKEFFADATTVMQRINEGIEPKVEIPTAMTANEVRENLGLQPIEKRKYTKREK
jgi:hypothetical protein